MGNIVIKITISGHQIKKAPSDKPKLLVYICLLSGSLEINSTNCIVPAHLQIKLMAAQISNII